MSFLALFQLLPFPSWITAHSSPHVPEVIMACDLLDRLITARDSLQFGHNHEERISGLMVLIQKSPPTLQRIDRVLRQHLAITPEAIVLWQTHVSI